MEKLVKWYGFSGGVDGVQYMPKATGSKFALYLSSKPTLGADGKVHTETRTTMSRARLKALYLSIGQALEESEPARNSHNNPYKIQEPLG